MKLAMDFSIAIFLFIAVSLVQKKSIFKNYNFLQRLDISENDF
jgi:hypothetical protein